MKKIITVILIISFLIWPVDNNTYALSISDTAYWFTSAGTNLIKLNQSGYMLSNTGVDEALNRYVVAQKGGETAYLLKIDKNGNLIYAKLIPAIEGYEFDNRNYLYKDLKQTFNVVYKNGYVYVMSPLRNASSGDAEMAHYKINSSNGTVIKQNQSFVESGNSSSRHIKAFRFDDVIDDYFMYYYQKGKYSGWKGRSYLYKTYNPYNNRLYRVGSNGQRDSALYYFKVHNTSNEYVIGHNQDDMERTYIYHSSPWNESGTLVGSYSNENSGGVNTYSFVKLPDGKIRWFVGDNNGYYGTPYLTYKEANKYSSDSFYDHKIDIDYKKTSRRFEYADNNKMVLYGKASSSHIKVIYYDYELNKLQEFDFTGLSSRGVNAFLSGTKIYLNEKKFVLRDVKDEIVDLNTYSMNNEPTIVINNASQVKVFKNSQTINITGTVTDSDNDPVIVSATIGGVKKSVTVYNTASPKSWSLLWGTNEIPQGIYDNIVFTAENP